MTSKITFYGGTGTVTGANFLLDAGDKKILVDCGAFEREHVCDPANSAPFSYDVTAIDALVVTHAHQDHIGRIPRLVKAGFRGPIFSTAATMDLSAIMLEDALSIITREAEQHRCELLYDEPDLAQTMRQWVGKGYHESFDIGSLSVEFLDAGHVLGSAFARIKRDGRSVVFTGDIGNMPEPLLRQTESPEGANYIVMESVYGDRVHEGKEQRLMQLREAVEGARQRRGTLLIPSFSLERTQVLLYELNRMVEDGSMPAIPIYLDAPLAIRVTEVFRRYFDYMNPEVQARTGEGDDPFMFPGLSVIRDTRESFAIHASPDPKVIIAGAGMSAGGRIRAHEKQYLPDKKAGVLFVGYQAPGSLGRRIQDGAKSVDIDGDKVRVHAHIDTLTGYSGHADRDQLMDFVESTGESLQRVFVTMGEPKVSNFFAQRLKDFLDVDAAVPEAGQTFNIEL